MALPGNHLGETHLKLDKLRDACRKKLPDILDKDHGVEKIYHLDASPLDDDCPGIIYICRPKIEYMRYIANHIRQWTKQSKKLDCWLFFVPERTLVCERVLEEEGVKGDITIGNFAMDWIPYEDDLISMELEPSTWKEIYLDGDTTSIYYAARSLMQLQSIYGLFPRIIGKGDGARLLAEQMLRMRREQTIDKTKTNTPTTNLLNSVSNHIDQLIIIDRHADLITPLCTELTYEGLIDETMNIRHGFVELDASLVTPPPPPTTTSMTSGSAAAPPPPPVSVPGKKKKHVLNSSDKLFSQLRDQNFAVVGGMLNKHAKRINESYEERHHAKTVAQIRDFVSRLGDLQQEHQSLRIHTTLAEQIMEYTITDEFNKILEVQQNVVAGIDGTRELDYIEEMINKQKPLIQVLRLLCLMSVAQGGLKSRVYDHFEREITQTYGYEHINTLHRLTQLGLLSRRTTSGPASRNTFAASRRALRLIVDDVDEFHPNDISYVYSGYAPLSVRLVQCALRKLGPVPTSSVMNALTTTGASTVSLLSYMGAASISSNGSNDSHDTSSTKMTNLKPIFSGVTITNGWEGYEDTLKSLPGKSFEINQVGEYGSEANAAIVRAKKNGSQQPKTTVVFYLGGCTHTEISALRFLAQHDEGREYLVATTQLINGSSLLQPILESRQRASLDTNLGN
ncbi:Sec1-like protein [Hesseltinella vesiculosa]|uniref:Sec1-like protein n=1 Tax=Hesseltinella vesiculosa TaxID=101127 RepID=A0A1X2GLM5_9FUNG|nr:Sec1-like protein [Hesseltinella vesiculosa]